MDNEKSFIKSSSCYPAAGCHSSAADLPVPGNPAGLPYIEANIAWVPGRPVCALRRIGSTVP